MNENDTILVDEMHISELISKMILLNHAPLFDIDFVLDESKTYIFKVNKLFLNSGSRTINVRTKTNPCFATYFSRNISIAARKLFSRIPEELLT